MYKKRKYKWCRNRKWKKSALGALSVVLARDIANGVEQYRLMKRYTVPTIPDWEEKGLPLEGYGPPSHSEEEWDDILKEIVWTFKEIANGYPKDPLIYLRRNCRKDDYSEEEYAEKLQAAQQEQEEYRARIRRGKEFFVEYFEALWE